MSDMGDMTMEATASMVALMRDQTESATAALQACRDALRDARTASTAAEAERAIARAETARGFVNSYARSVFRTLERLRDWNMPSAHARYLHSAERYYQTADAARQCALMEVEAHRVAARAARAVVGE
jgi:hypothetical protein